MASELSFRPEMLEKALQLIHLLNSIFNHPFLADRVVLKGGTALNFFLFDLPRLSVDIDLNYIGAIDREKTEEERPRIVESIRAVAAREGFTITREPSQHAGGKFRLRYDSELIVSGNLELDINFMLRVPLWVIEIRDSISIAGFQATRIPVLEEHELTAGKLAALLARTAARDLYDAHRLLTQCQFDAERLRVAFTVYGGLNRRDWRTTRIQDVNFREDDFANQLLPLLRGHEQKRPRDAARWGEQLVAECRRRLSIVLPPTERELAFLDNLLDLGEIKPELLTDDAALQKRIHDNPGLLWKAHNVRRYRGVE